MNLPERDYETVGNDATVEVGEMTERVEDAPAGHADEDPTDQAGDGEPYDPDASGR